MPYIKNNQRNNLDEHINKLFYNICSETNLAKGAMNYAITKLVHMYVTEKGICYDTLSDMTGVLNDVKTEFERTLVANYEDWKIKEHGPIGVIPEYETKKCGCSK